MVDKWIEVKSEEPKGDGWINFILCVEIFILTFACVTLILQWF